MFGFFKSAKAKYDEVKDVYRRSDAAWLELNDAFHAAGFSFGSLNTTLRQALQREAVLNGAESAFALFLKLATEADLIRDPVAEILNEGVGRPKRRFYAGQPDTVVVGEIDGPTMGPVKRD